MSDSQFRACFGRVLRRYREDAKMSQEQLANGADLERAYISLMERGKRQPTIKTLFELAKELGVRPHEIVKAMEEEWEQTNNK